MLLQRSAVRELGLDVTHNSMRMAVKEAEQIRETVSLLNNNKAFDTAKLKAEFDAATDIRKTTLYHTIPIVAAWDTLGDVAKKEGYEFRVPKRQARNPVNTPTPEEEKILDKLESGNVEEIFEIDDVENKVVFARPIRLTNDCLTCHGDPANSPTADGRDMLGFKMENWKTGEVHGAFILKADMNRVQAGVAKGLSTTLLWTGPLVIAIAVGFYFLNRRMIVKPLMAVANVLSTNAEQANTASSQVAAASQSLAAGASEQAASLEVTSSSLEEISSMTKKNADTAAKASSLTSEAKSISEKGHGAMARMSTAIADIQNSASETAKIIKTIDEIAFQTNLLALNAAVEAARAGEAGKGFAVVAEEVRNLAMRSAEAAKNTAALIDGSVATAKNGVLIADEVAANLAEIRASNAKVDSLVTEIATACSEQSTGISQVAQSVQEMDKVTQSNAAAAEESAASAQELSGQSEQLHGLVSNLIALVQGGHSADRGIVQCTDKTNRPSGKPEQPKKLGETRTTGQAQDYSDFDLAA
ncbi:MAG: methyl-accepting chemotaxis protein [Tepidisphaeraceae bacterium]